MDKYRTLKKMEARIKIENCYCFKARFIGVKRKKQLMLYPN